MKKKYLISFPSDAVHSIGGFFLLFLRFLFPFIEKYIISAQIFPPLYHAFLYSATLILSHIYTIILDKGQHSMHFDGFLIIYKILVYFIQYLTIWNISLYIRGDPHVFFKRAFRRISAKRPSNGSPYPAAGISGVPHHLPGSTP